MITIHQTFQYLSFDTVHLIKNARNNLRNHKRFLFLSFIFNGFKDSINVTGGELKWKMPYDVFERDSQLDGNLKKAPKLTLKVLHLVSNKQNVLLALAILMKQLLLHSSRIFLNT